MLAEQDGGLNLRQAALRRAVSTAYHAVFHALSFICADGLVRWSRTDLVRKAYRSLGHAVARHRLAAIGAQAGQRQSVKRISAAFGNLQKNRLDADYESPRSLFSRGDAKALINQPREAMDLLAALSLDERRALAVELLLVRSR